MYVIDFQYWQPMMHKVSQISHGLTFWYGFSDTSSMDFYSVPYSRIDKWDEELFCYPLWDKIFHTIENACQ